MTCLWLVVIETGDDFDLPEAEGRDYLEACLNPEASGLKIRAWRRGGLLARKVLDELPPVRHELMGRPRG